MDGTSGSCLILSTLAKNGEDVAIPDELRNTCVPEQCYRPHFGDPYPVLVPDSVWMLSTETCYRCTTLLEATAWVDHSVSQ